MSHNEIWFAVASIMVLGTLLTLCLCCRYSKNSNKKVKYTSQHDVPKNLKRGNTLSMYSITMENTDTVEAKSNKERTASKIMRGKQSKNLREERDNVDPNYMNIHYVTTSPVDQRLAIPELRGSWMSRGHGSAPHLETNPDCESTYVDPLSSDYCNFAFGSASPYGNVFHSEYQCIESADESDIYENTRIGQRKESDNDYATGDFDAAAFLEKNYDV